MTGHHELCPRGQDRAARVPVDEWEPCLCPVIAAVEAVVRAQVERDIVALHQGAGEWCCPSDAVHAALVKAERAARGGGSDA